MNSSTTHPFSLYDETIMNENLFSNNFFSLEGIDELDLSLAPDLDLEFNDYMQFESLEDFQKGNNTSFFPESLETNPKCNDLFFPEMTNLETVANEPVSPMINECTDISEVKIANTNSPVYDLLKIEQFSPVQTIPHECEIQNQNQNQIENQNSIEVVTNNDQIVSKQQTKQKSNTTQITTKKQPLRRSTRRRTPKLPIVSTRVTRSSRRSKITNNQPKQQQKKPTNMRKRRHTTTKGSKTNGNNTTIDNGKEIFKLLTGQLWIMSGGSTYKFLLPYTEKFAQAIGEKLNADENEVNGIKSQLKYLLSNSRRTFTEYVLEIFLAVLSLVHMKSKPKTQLSVRFKKVLMQMKEFQMNQTKVQKKPNRTDNNQTTTTQDYIQFQAKINHKLEKIASKIFTQEVLMYWFEKRFFPRFENTFSQENQTFFYSNYLFELAKSKFILMSWILAKELLKRDGPVKQYSQLIDLEYNKNAVNLYTNNRGRKLRLIKELIVKFGLNNGNYWDSSSTTFFNQNNLTINTLLNQQPFKQIMENPLLNKFSKNNTQNTSLVIKKRTLATNANQEMIGLDWISKNRILNNSIDFSQI
ncbi:hypothetical protein M0813_22643 [Anaeramoeba flamelloides]|uniref:Uncharacterized protein n=1 Tax=Anaeramoeba flamelloides TaxID=1746091 RepID=A0ABQ8YD82_9EUKA|nr:hypothetical protein M0813_22643 [Anaeramoeba flamelloides]